MDEIILHDLSQRMKLADIDNGIIDPSPCIVWKRQNDHSESFLIYNKMFEEIFITRTRLSNKYKLSILKIRRSDVATCTTIEAAKQAAVSYFELKIAQTQSDQIDFDGVFEWKPYNEENNTNNIILQTHRFNIQFFIADDVPHKKVIFNSFSLAETSELMRLADTHNHARFLLEMCISKNWRLFTDKKTKSKMYSNRLTCDDYYMIFEYDDDMFFCVYFYKNQITDTLKADTLIASKGLCTKHCNDMVQGRAKRGIESCLQRNKRKPEN